MKIYNLKTCSFCRERVLFYDFFGKSSVCSYCVREQKKRKKEVRLSYRKKNRHKLSERASFWNKINKQKYSLYQKEYRIKNKPKVSAIMAKRRAKKLNATPEWLSEEQKDFIKSLYFFCNSVSGVVGKRYHVDHIVPLTNKKVCGLHVPWNLQVIPAKDNLEKSNKFDDWA